jgi:hypothetical protein
MLEKAKAHFRQVVDDEGLHCISIPEWGNAQNPAKIYFKPISAMPVKTYSRLVELGTKQTVEAFIDILILRCCDENGQSLFKLMDKTEMLREISPVVVCDIIKQMSEAEKEEALLSTVEQMEKNC